VCDECSFPQSISHARLAPLVQGQHSQISLLCANPACPQSHCEHESETLSAFRKREFRESEKTAKVAAEAKRVADAQADKDRMQAARDAWIQRQYLQYLNHQWNAGQTDEKICPRSRWFQLTDGTRRIVLDMIEKNAAVRIAGL
jgi:hypothetical protein